MAGELKLSENFNPFANKDMSFRQPESVRFSKLNKDLKKNLKQNGYKTSIGQEFENSGGTAGLITSLGAAGAGVAGGMLSNNPSGAGQMVGAVLGNIPVVGKYVQAAQAVGNLVGSAMGVESAANLSEEDIKSLGLSKAASFGNGLAETFGLNAIAGKVGGVTSKFAMTDQVKGLGTAYDLSKLTAAENASGKGALFGKNKMNASIAEAQRKANVLNNIAEQSNLAKQADASYLHTQNEALYSGSRPGLISVVEKGGELKTAKSLINQ